MTRPPTTHHLPPTPSQTPRTLLITGGAGFIGSNFVRHILTQHSDVRVVNYDKLTYAGNLENLADVNEGERYHFVRGDISDPKAVARTFEDEKPWAVVSFAAESHVDRSILDATPFVDTNVKGTQVLLETIRRYPVERFVQISTDEVYGALGEEGAFTESSPIQPNSPYAACKAAADLIALAYAKTYGLPIVVTRSSNNYGPYQFPEKLVPLMIRNALTGKELPIYGEGRQVRDWLHVEDNCRAIDVVLHKGLTGEVYNIGGECEKRNIEVVKLICEILRNHPGARDLRPKIQFIKDPRGAAHDFRYALDCSKIKRELGWAPLLGFDEGMERTVAWYLSNREWTERVITGEYQEYYRKIYGT
jgi:dTDP-glucose 4,6-dehydratase